MNHFLSYKGVALTVISIVLRRASAAPIPITFGTAAQSTTLRNFKAALAFDSQVNLTHTQSSHDNATWEAFLTADQSFGEITIATQSSGCCSRLRDITIQIVDFSGNVGSDFTGGVMIFSSELLNPEKVLGAGSNGQPTITVNPSSATDNMIRIERTPDPALSGSKDAGNSNEANVLFMDQASAKTRDGISTFKATPDTIAPVNRSLSTEQLRLALPLSASTMVWAT